MVIHVTRARHNEGKGSRRMARSKRQTYTAAILLIEDKKATWRKAQSYELEPGSVRQRSTESTKSIAFAFATLCHRSI